MMINSDELAFAAAAGVLVFSGIYIFLLWRFIEELKDTCSLEWARLGRPRLVGSLLPQINLYVFILFRKYRRLGNQIKGLGDLVNVMFYMDVIFIGLVATIFSGKTVWMGPFPVTFHSIFR